MTKKYYRREYMREYTANSTFISNDGCHVERDYYDQGIKKTYEPKMYLDNASQRFYIDLRNIGRTYIDEMVIMCYGSRKPKDGKNYVIHHKDWDFRNDHRNNLEWVEDTPQYQAEKAKKMKEYFKALKLQWYKDRKITVDKNCVIKQDGVELSIDNTISDSDLGYIFHTIKLTVKYQIKVKYQNSGQIRYESKSLEVDKIMDDFGFVEGDKENFKEPVILHINHDFMDFYKGNLKWCEKSDPEYLEYMKQARLDVLAQDKAIHGRWLSPGEWNVLYGGIEDYQNWDDLKGKDSSWTPEKIEKEIEDIRKRKNGDSEEE